MLDRVLLGFYKMKLFFRWASVALFLLLFVINGAAFAEPGLPRWFPAELAQVLRQMGYGDAVDRAKAIPEISIQEFYRRFVAERPVLLGGGYNGVAFAPQSGSYKLSHLVFFDPQRTPDWQAFRQIPAVQALPDRIWENKLGDGKVTMAQIRAALERPEDLASQPVLSAAFDRLRSARVSERELLGSVLWSIFDPDHTPLPLWVTSDYLAYAKPFGRGVPLDQILKSEREGTALHRQYQMPRLWQGVIAAQEAAEQMLLHFGVMIDLVVPGNLVVYGQGSDLRVVPIDLEMIEPTPETRRYYSSRGFILPEWKFLSRPGAIQWPLMPNHIVSSVHWSLSYEQALTYLQCFWNLQTREQAIQKLMHLERWNIWMFPGMNSYSNHRRAWKEGRALGLCSELLTRSGQSVRRSRVR